MQNPEVTTVEQVVLLSNIQYTVNIILNSIIILLIEL